MPWLYRRRSHPEPGPTEAERRVIEDMVALACGRPSTFNIARLFAVALEPQGSLRKVALDVLGHVAKNDADIATVLGRRLLEVGLREPWIGRYYARTLGRIGVADFVVLSALTRARKVDVGSRALRVASRNALYRLHRRDLAFGGPYSPEQIGGAPPDSG